MGKDLYLVGNGGGPNFGADLIGRVWVEYLAKKYPNRTIWLDTRNAGVTAGYFSKYKNVKAVDTFWKLRNLSASAGESIESRIEWLNKKIKYAGTPKYDIHLKNIENNVESIHFIGGGYVNSIWPDNLLLFAQAAFLKEKNLSIKVYITGAGLMPASDNFSQMFKKITKTFDFIEGRDSRTAKELNVTNGIDDVWMSFSDKLQDNKPVWKRNEVNPDIMLLIQKDFNYGKEQSLLETAIDIIRHQPNFSSDTTIGVAEAIPATDYWAFPAIKKEFSDNNVSFYSFQNLWENGFPAGENTTWITTRFQYHLIGSSFGSKGIVLTTGSKYYDIKHTSLINNGTGWNIINIDNVSSYQATKNNKWQENVAKLSDKKFTLAEDLYYFK